MEDLNNIMLHQKSVKQRLQNKSIKKNPKRHLVGTGGFEPPTSCVSSKRSPPELRAYTGQNQVILFKVFQLVKKKGSKNGGIEGLSPADTIIPYTCSMTLLPCKDLTRVTSSAYSKSIPTGIPKAIRLTVMPSGCISRVR